MSHRSPTLSPIRVTLRILALLLALVTAMAFANVSPVAAEGAPDDGGIEFLEWDDDDDEWDDDEWDDDEWDDDEWDDDDGPSYSDGSLTAIVRSTGARYYWRKGFTGASVDVAVIDTGIAPVEGLNASGKIINGPDLSFESQAENLRYLDANGHGTHLASIIAGKDSNVRNPYYAYSSQFVGMAPGARLVNVKVGDAMGAVDVSQVIAAINWVTEHKNDNGMNIRVLNLSFGTDSVQDYEVDPLAHAVEQAWDAGIVVVVAAGNDGNSAALRNPAKDPYVIAVGANDDNGTRWSSDDVIPSFSSCGTSSRHVDLVAPGKSVEGLRNPGSDADQQHPNAVVDSRRFKGSGTSQAAAVVAGAAALILDHRPNMTPDQVKALLMDTAKPISGVNDLCQGDGTLNLRDAYWSGTPNASQNAPKSNGKGSLDAARGSAHVEINGVVLEGEVDIHGNEFDAGSHAGISAQGLSWSGGDWNGLTWSGLTWSGLTWSGLTWSGITWSGLSWSGLTWSSNAWTGLSWSGITWSDNSWSNVSWASDAWGADVWAGLSWR